MKKKTDPEQDDVSLTVSVPVTAHQVATLQKTAETDLPAILKVKVRNRDDYAFADELLTDAVRKKDAAIAMRQTATGPLKAVVKTIEGWFRPLVQTLEKTEAHLKGELGGYRLREDEKQRSADLNVAKAAEAHDTKGLLRALEASTKAGAAGEFGRAAVSFRWAVKSADVVEMIQGGVMLAPFLTADVRALEKMAAERADQDSPPRVSGVVFEKVAKVGARR